MALKPYFELENGILYNGDALEVLKSMPSGIIQTCITSPPYWGLRDYGVPGQLGLEKTPEEYVSKMVEIFREVRRVLRDDGTLWLNLGSSYAGSWGDSGHRPDRDGIPGEQRDKNTEWFKRNGHPQGNKPVTVSPNGFKPKDLVPIPWMVAMALQKDGWYLRSDIIWHKPNPMPESVTDRPTKAHEYIFLMSKSAKYFYDADAIREADHPDGRKQTVRLQTNRYDGPLLNKFQDNEHQRWSGNRNKRTVWTIPTMPYKEAHFATFPPKLIEPCVLAGSKEGDTTFDPFAGAGTTLLVSEKYSRKWIGIELNQEYCGMIIDRLKPEIQQRKLF